MNKLIQALIEYEKTQIGYKQESNGWTKYGQWYADNIAHSQSFAYADWCVMLQTYSFDKVGVPDYVYPYISPQGSSVRWNMDWMEKNRRRTGANDMPQPGDLVYYCWSGKDDDWDHIGLCIEVSGTSADDAVMTVIEGNIRRDGVPQVVTREVRYRDPIVRATTRPNYPDDVTPNKPDDEPNVIKMPELSFLLKTGVRNQAVEILQAALIGNGYSIVGGNDGYFGQYTKDALIKYQKDNNLIADGTAGTETFRCLFDLK